MKPREDTASASVNPAENKVDRHEKPSHDAEHAGQLPSLETLRRKLDRAILAEQWEAVKVIGARIREIEHASVVDLATRRGKK